METAFERPRDFSLPGEPSLPVKAEGETPIDSERVYGLPELIDIAESANPDTRIGWERARQAALAVGLAKAEYLPTISAIALAGYQHTAFPISAAKDLVIPTANGHVDAVQLVAAVVAHGRHLARPPHADVGDHAAAQAHDRPAVLRRRGHAAPARDAGSLDDLGLGFWIREH